MTKRSKGWHIASHVILTLALLLIFGIFMQVKTSQWNKLALVNQDLTNQLKDASKDMKTQRSVLVATISKLQFRLDPVIVDIYADAILASAKRWKLHPNLIACVIYRESSFNPVAVSRVGAVGPMQIILKYHMDKLQMRGWSKQDALYLANNIDLGSQIIREYFDQKGNIQEALSKYVGDTSKKHLDYVTDILKMFTESLNKTDRVTYKDMIDELEKEFEDVDVVVAKPVEKVKKPNKPKVIEPIKTKKVTK